MCIQGQNCRDYQVFFFSSRRRHTRYWRDWSSDVCSSDLSSGDITPPSTFGATTVKGPPGTKDEVLEAKKIKPLPHCPGGRVPAALSAVAMKALSVRREQRYQSVAAFSGDVEAYQGGFATGAEN